MKNNRYYELRNADGKVWVMPARHLRVAMGLYQPSGIKGKMLKRWFPLLHGFPLVRSVVRARKVSDPLPKSLLELLRRLFGEEDLEYAVFEGTPSVHQKRTIQLFRGERILGYCKTSTSLEVRRLFEREAALLEHLERQGVRGIPRSLYVGEYASEAFAFVQNTCKSLRSKTSHQWGALHEAFLDQLCERTKQRLLFEETDYYRTLSELLRHLDWIPGVEARRWVVDTIEGIFRELVGREVTYCAYHADFTPWNMFEERGQLFVFDWEYAQETYPPRLDKYHFFTQKAIFEAHWNVKEITAYVSSVEGRWIDRTQYVRYLMDMIARFVIRERGVWQGDMAKSLQIWLNVLAFLRK